MNEGLTLAQFIAKSRVMHSFLPDDDERTKNEFVADELVAAGYTNEVTGEMVGRAWNKQFEFETRPVLATHHIRDILEAALDVKR